MVLTVSLASEAKSIKELTTNSVKSGNNTSNTSNSGIILLFFWAEWAAPSKDMRQVFLDLHERYKQSITFFEVSYHRY